MQSRLLVLQLPQLLIAGVAMTTTTALPNARFMQLRITRLTWEMLGKRSRRITSHRRLPSFTNWKRRICKRVLQRRLREQLHPSHGVRKKLLLL